MMFCKRKLSVSLFVLLLVFCFALPSFAANDGKININTASAEELATLNKVGEKYAQRIVEYREANGPFEKAEDIVNVKGIGPKIWEVNKDRIVLE
jgi:competence protein ComEA